MKTILIAGSKGGSSKSTLSLCLAACLAQNYSVCLIDTDPQGTLQSFKDLIKIDLVDLASIKQSDYNVSIIDSPPYLSNQLPELIKLADYVLLPCRPNAFDAVALKTIISLIKNKPCGIVLTQVQHRVNITDVLDVLQGYNIPILKQTMSHRVSYARAAFQNLFDSDDIKAQKEILSITIEILSQIK